MIFVIHIGDKSESDIKGVQDCGFLTIWFNEFSCPKSYKILPDYEIHDILEVSSLIKRISDK